MLYHSSITNPLVLLGYRGVSWGIAGVSLECCSVWNIVVLEYRWSITGYTDHWILLDITLDITGILQMCSPIQRATHLTIRHNPSQSVLQFVRQRMRKMYGQGVVLWCQWEGFGESSLAGSFDVQLIASGRRLFFDPFPTFFLIQLVRQDLIQVRIHVVYNWVCVHGVMYTIVYTILYMAKPHNHIALYDHVIRSCYTITLYDHVICCAPARFD